MLLTTKQSCIYAGVHRATLIKKKLAHTIRGKKKYYNTKLLDKKFPDAPKIEPDEETETNIIQLETEISTLDTSSKGQALFDTILSHYIKSSKNISDYEISLVSSLTVIRLQLSAVELALAKTPTCIDTTTLHSKVLRNADVAEKEIAKYVSSNQQ